MKDRYYFAYGSNMNLEQMKYRCPAAEVVENVRLENYRLAFRGRAPGNGVATVLPEKGSYVEGVLWKITEACEKSLDFYEGFPSFYGKESIRVKNQDYTENTIENGMKRLSVIKTPFNKTNIDRINRQMLKMSGQRDTLKERWNSALAVYDKMDIVDETEVKDKFVTSVVFWDAILTMILSGILCLIGAIGAGIVAAASQNGILAGTCYFFIAAGLAGIMIRFPKIFMLGSPLKRLKAFGNGIRKALEEQQLLEETHCKVETESNGPDNHIIYLSGGSGRDKALFAQCVNEFFDVIDNQRYILVKKKGHKGLNGFYAIPNCFSKKKEDAERFAKCMHPYIGNYDCVYTRNEKGRELLLEGRVKALANREERCISHKKVKGALE